MQPLECVGEILDEVTSHDALFAQFTCRSIACQSVQVHTHDTGIFLFVAACQQTGNDTSQYVAAAGSRHAGIAGAVDEHMTVGQAEGGVVPLQHDIGLKAFRHLTGL